MYCVLLLIRMDNKWGDLYFKVTVFKCWLMFYSPCYLCLNESNYFEPNVKVTGVGVVVVVVELLVFDVFDVLLEKAKLGADVAAVDACVN